MWNARTLTIGGRLMLVRSVLGSLGSYLFSIYKVPKSVIVKLESICNAFLWGNAPGNKGITWIAWGKTMNSNDHGGLGIGSLRAFNLALLLKWWWRFRDNSNSIWKNVITTIYGVHGGLGVSISRSIMNTVWGRISKVNIDLGEYNLDLNNIF
uniref:Reverse transcriptase zinc-binding domain-containing protein n=1 Tax=Lactuca sativa TaxID=4236 RepID=A0A9R1WMW2_LACSA|nr:hypothetical protein LSAT_V11C100039920 [Lactuca sativa]